MKNHIEDHLRKFSMKKPPAELDQKILDAAREYLKMRKARVIPTLTSF